MTVISKLASTLGRRDEKPNEELAAEIVAGNNKKAVRELVLALKSADKNLQSDSIKVLYEVGEKQPRLIAEYDSEFLELLSSGNNRLVWGAMTALDAIAAISQDAIYKNLPQILDIAEKGSVITRDHGVGILVKLSSTKKFADKTLALLLDQLRSCPTNQLPMYAESALPVIGNEWKNDFVKVLQSRLSEIDKESKRKRIEKVMKKLIEDLKI